ncbi:hypothetical protein JKP88DRAFT_348810 [Tribonema minus]|uniref:Uncharacterized protein n=1 Tax=Tribonema minus TaxID=303371 RepID=A0A836CG65_9STRA|nr:hypothetical protein JKP88DRAFT_348810 [Tribonema minus]
MFNYGGGPPLAFTAPFTGEVVGNVVAAYVADDQGITVFLAAAMAGCFFAEKAFMLGKRNTITATALLAALICVVYTTWELAYFYAGLMAQPDTCKTATAWGVLRSISNALAFLHLFLRADVANSINPHWHMWRRVGIALTVINWALLIVAPALRRITLIPTKLGARCSAQYESVSFTLMWVSQLVCHVAFTLMFVYPLVRHMNELKQSTADSALEAGVAARGSSRDDDVYRTLVRRAAGALALSATFTGENEAIRNRQGVGSTATEARSSSVVITPARYS